MAEKKKHTIVSADDGHELKDSHLTGAKPNIQQAPPVGNASTYRLLAIIFWVLAFACEVLAVLILFGKINMTFIPQLWQLIIFIVLDLIFVIIGSQMWKKANHIRPASKENKVKFWLWNNMGVIVCAFAFIPFVVLALTDKNADKKTKTIAAIAAIIALLIGGAASIDYNPVS